jgi:hypothetical protein
MPLVFSAGATKCFAPVPARPTNGEIKCTLEVCLQKRPSTLISRKCPFGAWVTLSRPETAITQRWRANGHDSAHANGADNFWRGALAPAE